MNILILNWRDPMQPNAGGAEQVTLAHAKGWINDKHTVWWFSSYFKGAKRYETYEGITIVRYGYYAFGVQIAAFFWYLFGRHPKFNLVVDQFHGLPFFTPLYVRVKKFAFIHEVAREVWKLNPWPRPFRDIVAFLGTTFEPLLFKLFYASVPFLTVSESTKNDLLLCGISEKNITIINNGVHSDALPQKLPLKQGKKTVIFLGAISHDKGIGDALACFSEIHSVHKDWQFWIVGKASTDMEEFLNAEIKKRNLQKHITYFGFVDNAKKFELLACAHCMINPSIHEGWGLVNIEANSVGTPVVAYDVKGIRDSIRANETGILVAKGNYKKLGEEAISLIENEKMYQTMRIDCQKWAQSFTWTKANQKSNVFIYQLS